MRSEIGEEYPVNDKLIRIKEKITGRNLRIAIIGLGSVGNYLLDYLFSSNLPLEIFILGRSREKIQSDINIVRVASSIRGFQDIDCTICEVDFTDVDQLATIFEKIDVDIIVNSSRAYSHIKYGAISWKTIRAYGIWTPLSIKYVKNIMKALAKTSSNPIVINTSYSDAVNPWLKSAGMIYPDFGSGNLNHLIPRIRFAVAQEFNISDLFSINIHLAISHFHDVVISKEGHVEGIEPLISIDYQGNAIKPDMKKIYAMCAIAMPTDSKRNMMNASSNFEIIKKILDSLKNGVLSTIHSPGALGFLGGYPINIHGENPIPNVEIDESSFSFEEMKAINARSIYCDGIEKIENGELTYTDELLAKIQESFHVVLPKKVHLDDSDEVASMIISEIIEKSV